ncbi:hypothetical protein NE237_023975 [Protea cynaroides]|uniref:Uncharacterized protein n=1 Tax=Protea cynaroides TaxID=273540 RepID=A0A9Q0K5P8_9MAGN|nr:hypothetical protein NE237_023975 [Protea cynaroides]
MGPSAHGGQTALGCSALPGVNLGRWLQHGDSVGRVECLLLGDYVLLSHVRFDTAMPIAALGAGDSHRQGLSEEWQNATEAMNGRILSENGRENSNMESNPTVEIIVGARDSHTQGLLEERWNATKAVNGKILSKSGRENSNRENRPIKESAYELPFHRAMGFAPIDEYWKNLRRIVATHLSSPKIIANMIADLLDLEKENRIDSIAQTRLLFFGR